MIFEANTEQIRGLDSVHLVQLMKKLMLAECSLTGIPLRNATVPLQITVPDGGEDGQVEWRDGSDSTDFFPARCSIFQSKAQNLTDSTVKAEIVAKPRGGAVRLNAAVSEALSKRGAYILFSSHPY